MKKQVQVITIVLSVAVLRPVWGLDIPAPGVSVSDSLKKSDAEAKAKAAADAKAKEEAESKLKAEAEAKAKAAAEAKAKEEAEAKAKAAAEAKARTAGSGKPATRLPLSVYDGFWIGQRYCSELLVNSEYEDDKPGFKAKITFNVTDGKGQARIENARNITLYDLEIFDDGVARIVQRGSRKANSNVAWRVDSVGKVVENQISTRGPMTSGDKTQMQRSECGFDLTNDDVLKNVERYKTRNAK